MRAGRNEKKKRCLSGPTTHPLSRETQHRQFRGGSDREGKDRRRSHHTPTGQNARHRQLERKHEGMQEGPTRGRQGKNDEAEVTRQERQGPNGKARKAREGGPTTHPPNSESRHRQFVGKEIVDEYEIDETKSETKE